MYIKPIRRRGHNLFFKIFSLQVPLINPLYQITSLYLNLVFGYFQLMALVGVAVVQFGACIVQFINGLACKSNVISLRLKFNHSDVFL